MNKLIEHIIELLNKNIKSQRGIASIEFGDPFFVPNVSMPFIAVSPADTEIEDVTNVEEAKRQSVEVLLVLDARKYYNSSNSNSAMKEGALIMEEEGDDLTTKRDTILGVISEFYGDGIFNTTTSSINISYKLLQKREFPTVEITLTFDVERVPYIRLSS